MWFGGLVALTSRKGKGLRGFVERKDEVEDGRSFEGLNYREGYLCRVKHKKGVASVTPGQAS